MGSDLPIQQVMSCEFLVLSYRRKNPATYDLKFNTQHSRSGFAGQVCDHALQVAGFHGVGHISLRLFDPLIGDFECNVRHADLFGVLDDQRFGAVPHETFRRPAQMAMRR